MSEGVFKAALREHLWRQAKIEAVKAGNWPGLKPGMLVVNKNDKDMNRVYEIFICSDNVATVRPLDEDGDTIQITRNFPLKELVSTNEILTIYDRLIRKAGYSPKELYNLKT